MDAQLTKNNYLILKQDKKSTILIDSDGMASEVDKKPYELIDEMCIYYGSSLKGRIEAINQTLSIKQKAPVLISEVLEIIYFPTLSYKHKDCEWINYNQILHVKSAGLNKTKIEFISGYAYEIDINSRIIKNQIKRCEEYLNILRNHKL